jgi:hypothetical protein
MLDRVVANGNSGDLELIDARVTFQFTIINTHGRLIRTFPATTRQEKTFISTWKALQTNTIFINTSNIHIRSLERNGSKSAKSGKSRLFAPMAGTWW